MCHVYMRLLCRNGLVTGKDSFLMGPSGFGFMHPSIIAPDDPLVDQMISRTAAAAAMLSSSACVPSTHPNYCSHKKQR